MSTFVDASVWFAAANNRDSYNGRAKELLSAIGDPMLTDYVLVETWTLLRIRVHWRAAEQFWFETRRSGIPVERVRPADLDVAWTIGETFADQDFSIVDRTSFAVMERLGITRVASFDSDFAIYRYGRNRDRAFEVIR